MSALITTTENQAISRDFVAGSFVYLKRISRPVCRIGDHAVLRHHPHGDFSIAQYD
jgi:hypothetical protein